MTRTLTLAEALAGFVEQHGGEVENALQNQVTSMRAAAAEAQKGVDNPPPPSDPAEGVIDVTPTAGGFASMVRLFTDAAKSAEAALEAYEKLAGRAEAI